MFVEVNYIYSLPSLEIDLEITFADVSKSQAAWMWQDFCAWLSTARVIGGFDGRN